ncbi:MAG: CinA family protein [Treponema sp.]|jgi:PncC family amidohydrolase|nr:CinA family protein [Treponema sp.]
MEELNKELLVRAEKTATTLINILKERSITLALAESCTAGMVSALLAGIPGASAVLWGSFVTYTKEAKVSMLGIEEKVPETFGVVSEQTARAMAEGALRKSSAGISAAVTGLAGPSGDGSNVPVGTVWTAAVLRNGEITAKKHYFTGERNEVRISAGIAVLEMIINLLTKT